MNIIHVVIESSGEYDDYVETMIKGYTTPEKAERAMQQMREADRAYWETRDKFEAMFSNIRKVNVHPRPTLLQHPKQPKNVKKALWPQTYWDEKARVDACNKVAQIEYEAQLEIYFDILTNAAKKIFDSLGVPEKDRTQYGKAPYFHCARSRDTSYHIEELEIE